MIQQPVCQRRCQWASGPQAAVCFDSEQMEVPFSSLFSAMPVTTLLFLTSYSQPVPLNKSDVSVLSQHGFTVTLPPLSLMILKALFDAWTASKQSCLSVSVCRCSSLEGISPSGVNCGSSFFWNGTMGLVWWLWLRCSLFVQVHWAASLKLYTMEIQDSKVCFQH